MTSVLIVVYYLLTSFIAFYIPGYLFLQKIPLRTYQKIIWSCILGLALWGLQAWVFGLLSVRFLSYVYLIITAVVLYRISHPDIRKIWKQVRNFSLHNEFPVLCIIASGAILQLATAFFFGLQTSRGMSVLSIMPPDHEWHAAIISQIVKHIPPEQPLMSSIPLTGYHYFGDMIIGDYIRVFHLPLIGTTFQYFSLLLTVLFGLSALAFCRTIKLSKLTEWFVLFFLYFGGDFTPFITLVLGRGFNLQIGALESGATLLMNYPRAFSVLFLFAALGMFSAWWEMKHPMFMFTLATSLLFAFTVMSKVNIGILGMSGLFIFGIYLLIRRKYERLDLPILAAIFTLIIYLPSNTNSGGLIYTGFWRVQDYIVIPQLGLSRLELARRIFEEHHNTLRVFTYNLLFFGIYVLGTFGTKLIGLIQNRRSLSAIPFIVHLILLPGLAVTFVAGMFYIQSVGGANSFNFLTAVFIFSSIYSAVSLGYFIPKLKSRTLRVLCITIIVLITIPRSIYESYRMYTSFVTNKFRVVSTEWVDIYQKIERTLPAEAVFLQADYKMSYLGNKNVFIAIGDGLGVLSNLNIDTSYRTAVADIIYASTDSAQIRRLLKTNEIDYLITDRNSFLASEQMSEYLSTMFMSSSAAVMRIR